MKKTHLTLRLYRDKKREFRWSLIASNGRKLADSGEGYKRRRAMEKAIGLVLVHGAPAMYSVNAIVGDYRSDILLQDDTAPTAHRCKPNARC